MEIVLLTTLSCKTEVRSDTGGDLKVCLFTRYRMTPPESPREREGAGSHHGQDNNLMATTDINSHAEQKQRDQGRLEREQERDRTL